MAPGKRNALGYNPSKEEDARGYNPSKEEDARGYNPRARRERRGRAGQPRPRHVQPPREERAERTREGSYASYLLINKEHVRDGILFGLREYFLNWWKELAQKTMGEDLRIQRKRDTIAAVMGAFIQVVQLGVYFAIALTERVRAGTVGSLLMNVGLFRNGQSQIQSLADDLVQLYRNMIFLESYWDLSQITSTIESKEDGDYLSKSIHSIEFEKVSFRYPGAAFWALENVSFKISSGEWVCLVGEKRALWTPRVRMKC